MKSIKLRGICAAVTGALLMSFGVNAMADSTDDLLQALISKGVLTEEEGAQLLRGRDVEKAKKKDEIKATFKDGIGFESGDKSTAISVNGRVQLDYRNYGEKEATNDADTFDVRRAFMTVKGKFYNDYDFNITADFGSTTNNSQLDEAYFGINWCDQARFRFGQFKMPFGLEQNTSDIFTDFQERSLVDVLTPGKERGAMVFGVPTKGVYYGLAASTGRGKNTNNVDQQVEGLDIIGRATVNFAEIMGIGDTVYHVGGGFSRGEISPRQVTGGVAGGFVVPGGRTESRGISYFAPTAFTSAADEELTRTRYGLEGAVAMGPVKFQTEWIKHNYDGKNAGNVSFDKDIKAWYASLNWMVTGESFASTYKDGNWGRIKPKSDFIHPSAGYGTGAVELSLRYSDFNGDDFAAGSSPAGTGNVGTAANVSSATGAHSWTAGVQWILNPNTRLVLNYITTKFDGGDVPEFNNQGTAVGNVIGRTDEEKAITMRAQFDF